MKKEILNAPNNIIRGKIEIDTSLLNKLYYKILFNAQRDNRKYIIKPKKVGASVELTEEQRKLLDELDNIGYLSCKLTHEDIDGIIKRRNDKTHDSILEKIDILQKTVFRFTTGEHNDETTQTQLVGEVKNTDYGYNVFLSARLYKYLFYNVGIGYTPINLLLFFNFKNNYTRSLYAYLRSWSGAKREVAVDLKTLREDVFHLAKNSYKEYKRFSEKILKKAIEDINESGSMRVDIEETRNNKRKVCSITFKIKDYELRVIEGDESSQEEDLVTYWLEAIAVQNESLKKHLENKYRDYNLDSPIVRGVFIKAYEKTLATDKNKAQMLENKKNSNSNIALFHKIVIDEFTMHEIAITNGF